MDLLHIICIKHKHLRQPLHTSGDPHRLFTIPKQIYTVTQKSSYTNFSGIFIRLNAHINISPIRRDISTKHWDIWQNIILKEKRRKQMLTLGLSNAERKIRYLNHFGFIHDKTQAYILCSHQRLRVYSSPYAEGSISTELVRIGKIIPYPKLPRKGLNHTINCSYMEIHMLRLGRIINPISTYILLIIHQLHNYLPK